MVLKAVQTDSPWLLTQRSLARLRPIAARQKFYGRLWHSSILRRLSISRTLTSDKLLLLNASLLSPQNSHLTRTIRACCNESIELIGTKILGLATENAQKQAFALRNKALGPEPPQPHSLVSKWNLLLPARTNSTPSSLPRTQRILQRHCQAISKFF
jgi:hypothetical protein